MTAGYNSGMESTLDCNDVGPARDRPSGAASHGARRPARALLTLCGALALATAMLPAARAGRPVPVFDVSVPGTDQATAVQDAMRQALVRATGRQDAASDPAFAALVAHASDYVRASHPGDGVVQVTFDGAAVEQQIIAAGRSVWGADRPFTIVVLSPAPTGAADDETRHALEEIAEQRGLPVSLVPMPVTDQSGTPLGADVLLTDARRLGGDAVLVGRSDAAPPGGVWQWTLITGLATQSWNGPFDAGVNGAADALARVEGSALPLTEEEALVKVSGIGTLADYAAVERMLGEVPGVRRSGLAEADGNTATFRVLIRGGARAIERALASAQHLSRIEEADSGSPSAGGTAPSGAIAGAAPSVAGSIPAGADSSAGGDVSDQPVVAYRYQP